MSLRLFEIAGADPEFRPSPYCWRIRMALAHKGLTFEAVPWRAVEKVRIADSGGRTVPVLVDGARWIRESWDIACHLDQRFPDAPPLFQGEGDRVKARLIDHWTTNVLHPLMFRILVSDMVPLLAEKDQSYYQKRTYRYFGRTVDALAGEAEVASESLPDLLSPVSRTLSEAAYLGGAQPGYGDYILFGAFQWARVASGRQLIEPNSALGPWFEKLLDAFDGAGRQQPPRAHWH